MEKFQQLKQAARRAMKNAYAPYSKYRVGAAVLARSKKTSDGGKPEGVIFSGCNIENGSYGLTICAERTALFNAISSGYTKFEAIAITADGNMPYPCGACLQVMSEFSPDMTVIIFGNKSKTETRKIKELLTKPFKSAKLNC